MPVAAALHRTPWSAVADAQSGIISRRQLVGLGLTPTQAKANVAAGRWRRMLPGVYATFTGPVDTIGRTWAAVLYAGSGSAVAGRSALWLWSLLDEPPDLLTIAVPETRRVRGQPGVRVERRGGLNNAAALSLRHPSALPPRLRLEEALLDVTSASTESVALDLLLRATQRRLTTAARLRRSIEQRSRMRWRGVLIEALTDVDDGVASPLEARYRHDVERRHRLPAGVRNRPEVRPDGGRRYRDVRYREWQVIVELDGREAHPDDEAFRDLRRDNHSAAAGDMTLRYGWRDVVGDSCAVAAQVAVVLALGGWTGRPRPCSAACAARQVP
ncbi:hypothetical protein ACVBEQ_24020 [Nakamurella sp. GG22]